MVVEIEKSSSGLVTRVGARSNKVEIMGKGFDISKHSKSRRSRVHFRWHYEEMDILVPW